jgi:hypothetical protein
MQNEKKGIGHNRNSCNFAEKDNPDICALHETRSKQNGAKQIKQKANGRISDGS